MKILLQELKGKATEDSDYSSDSDLDGNGYDVDEEDNKLDEEDNKLDEEDEKIKEAIKSINEKLSEGDYVNLDEYPKLFVVHFRGIHFFKKFFDQVHRREYREKIKLKYKEDTNSPAVYELAKKSFGEVLEEEIKKNIQQQIHKELLSLKDTSPMEKFWVVGNDRTHENLLYQHFHRYVNNYESFREESKKKEHECYKKLSSTTNPYVSTTYDARHAVFYALGGKSKMAQGALRPTYDSELKAKHPKVGYVQVIMHSIQDISEQKPLFLSSLHAANKIDIKDRTLNERETTFLGYIPADNIVKDIVLRFPSFQGDYKSYYEHKYGMSKRSYNAIKKVLNSKAANTNLLEVLAEHYVKYLLGAAKKAAMEQGGHLVYISLDGTISLTPFNSFQISDIRKQKINLDIDSVLNLFCNNKTLQNKLIELLSSSLKKLDIEIEDLPSRHVLLFSQEPVFKLIKEEKFTTDELADTAIDVLEELLTCADILELLNNEDDIFNSLLKLHSLAKTHQQSFLDIVPDFINAIEKAEYCVSYILESYEKDPRHLEFMAGDPDDIVLENSDNSEIVRFGIEHYNIDIEFIKESLGDRDGDHSAALMDFCRASGFHEDQVQTIGNDSD